MSARPFIRLRADDNLAVAARSVPAGIAIAVDTNSDLKTVETIEMGHKVALRPIAKGQPIRKFGQTIGYATKDIPAGGWIHTHNVEAGMLSLDYAFCSEIPAPPTPITGRTFQGYRRHDGRAATRNYIGIVSTVNCSAHTSKLVAQKFNAELLEAFPNVDGVVPLTHKGGCAMQYGGKDHQQLTRTLAGFAKHPNIGAYIVIGLGCETAQASFLMDNGGLVQLNEKKDVFGNGPLVMNIQEQGGVAKTVARATDMIREMLPEANKAQRVPIPVSEIILGVECGGSDGNSGTTANPALGYCSDLLVAHGGTSVLSETPEIYGGEHLLTRRAINRQVADKLLERIKWWVDYTAMFGERIDINPSVGNKKGGLTTIYEKSLGAIAKGGTTALRAVYEYSEPITEKGFVIMDTPGYDPASVTGIVAGGCNVVCFTTGRGSVFGCKPVPTMKLATNTPMYNRMIDDMDINAGTILDGATIEQVGREIFEEVIAVASGKPTKSEAQGIGDEEFYPWTWGPVT
ncbi:MAG: altronate dehydratase family protein [Planctomycetaceae bacterium]|nr:altronate dehydratase family protein [Planctomycetaceae bacterium]